MRCTLRNGISRTTAILALSACGCSRLALDDPGGSGGGRVGPAPQLLRHPVISLVSAVGGPARARVGWKAHADPADWPHFAVFVGADPATLYSVPPALADPAGDSAILEGLADDAVLHVGLGVRAGPSGRWTPSGPILTVRTGAPIYVDPAAPPGGDGTTPATATNDLALAVFEAFLVQGGANVWVKGGDVGILSLPLYGGVFLSGGFDPAMLLEERDPDAFPTLLRGDVNVPVVQIQTGSGPAVVDGASIDGRLEASAGVEDTGTAFELRSVQIRDCRRGIDLRALGGTSSVPVVLSGVVVRDATVEGLRLEGPHDLWIESSEFRNCNNEGVALNDLVAPEFGTASCVVRATNFARNGQEGLEAHLALPSGAGNGGGSFRVMVQDCDFQENAGAGLSIDIDTEASPTWITDIELRGCTMRANGLAGVLLDLDSTTTALVHRVQCSANGAEGLHVSSESWPGMVTVSCSAMIGNEGVGLRGSFGQVGLLFSHGVLSGNGGGGFSSEVAPSAAASSMAYIQPTPWSNSLALASPEQDLGLPVPFLRAPREYAAVASVSGATLRLTAMPLLPLDGPVEVADDGVERDVTSLAGTNLTVDPPTEGLVVPTVAGLFGPGTGVTEDFRPSPGSIATGAGLAPPGGLPVDAGIQGSPPGGAPGSESAVPEELFRLASTSPAWTQALTPSSDLLLSFLDGPPAPASLPAGVFVVDDQGNPVAASLSMQGDQIRVSPPGGGWSPGDVLELFPALAAVDGRPLAVPVAIPLQVP